MIPFYPVNKSEITPSSKTQIPLRVSFILNPSRPSISLISLLFDHSHSHPLSLTPPHPYYPLIFTSLLYDNEQWNYPSSNLKSPSTSFLRSTPLVHLPLILIILLPSTSLLYGKEKWNYPLLKHYIPSSRLLYSTPSLKDSFQCLLHTFFLFLNPCISSLTQPTLYASPFIQFQSPPALYPSFYVLSGIPVYPPPPPYPILHRRSFPPSLPFLTLYGKSIPSLFSQFLLHMLNPHQSSAPSTHHPSEYPHFPVILPLNNFSSPPPFPHVTPSIPTFRCLKLKARREQDV